MSRAIAARLLIAGVAAVILLALVNVQTYPTGFYVNLPGGHWCGLELAPAFGPFCDVT